MNDLKRNRHFPENIASNIKFLNNLQPEWKRHVTIVRQTKNLHEADFTQIYVFLKMNKDEVNELRAERLTKSHGPLALMAHSQNSFNFPTTHKDQSSSSTHSQQSFPINKKYNPQPSLNQNFMQPPMTSLEDINDLTKGMNSGGNQNGLVVIPGTANQNGTGNVVAARAEEEFDFMATAGALDEIEEVNASCILMANLQHASTSGTQLDKAPVYDTDGSAEVQLNDNCYDIKIFNLFTQEEQYTDLLEPILEPQLVPQNENHVIFVAPSMVQSRGTIETSSAPNEETRAHQEIVYRNLVDQVAQVNMVNCNMRETNAELKSELARYKIQEQRIEISQDKYDKLKKCYQKSVYQEQCLTRKINALHLSSAKQITTLNDEISNLNKQLSKEKSSISSLMEEKKRLKHNFKAQEDKFLDKEIDLVAKVKDLENILFKRDETVQTMHMLNPKPDSFYHPNQKNGLRLPESLISQESSTETTNHDIMSIVQNDFVDVPSDLQTELDRTKEKLKLCILKKEKEYAVLWNNWYIKCEECKYDKISYDKAYNDMQQKVQRLQAQLKDLKGTSVTPHVDKPKLRAVTPHSKKLHASIPSHSVPQPREFNVMNHRNVIALGMFKIILSQTSRADLVPNKQSSASIRTNPITNSQRHVTFKENVSSDMVTASSIGLVYTTRTRRPQPKGNTRNVRVPSTSKNGEVKKNVTVKDHSMTLLLSKNQKTMSSECNNIKLAIQNDKSKIVCGTVRFGNDHIAAILGYGDLKWGNITITRVYFVEGLGHNLFLVGLFCDANLEVAFRRNTYFIRDLDGVDFLKDDYSRYTWVHFLRTKDETPEVIKSFLKKIFACLQAPVIIVGNKMHKAFPLLVRKFPLPEGTSHCLKKNATAIRKVLPLPEVCTAIIAKRNHQSKMTVSYRLVPYVPPFILAVT
nr:integrase, catalytic region, zinc finger, CCHC-type, peptidase aspartic, catalytic [Tanacetum cinerariifolium]